jgi:hypothetical protein
LLTVHACESQAETSRLPPPRNLMVPLALKGFIMSWCTNLRCNGTDYLCGKCRKLYPNLAESLDQKKRQRREGRQGQTSYGRGSRSGGYGRSSYSMKSSTFDGYPSLSRHRGDGATEIFYGPAPVSMDDLNHGHAVIKDGRLVYKRRPGESTPIIDKDN